MLNIPSIIFLSLLSLTISHEIEELPEIDLSEPPLITSATCDGPTRLDYSAWRTTGYPLHDHVRSSCSNNNRCTGLWRNGITSRTYNLRNTFGTITLTYGYKLTRPYGGTTLVQYNCDGTNWNTLKIYNSQSPQTNQNERLMLPLSCAGKMVGIRFNQNTNNNGLWEIFLDNFCVNSGNSVSSQSPTLEPTQEPTQEPTLRPRNCDYTIALQRGINNRSVTATDTINGANKTICVTIPPQTRCDFPTVISVNVLQIDYDASNEWIDVNYNNNRIRRCGGRGICNFQTRFNNNICGSQGLCQLSYFCPLGFTPPFFDFVNPSSFTVKTNRIVLSNSINVNIVVCPISLNAVVNVNSVCRPTTTSIPTRTGPVTTTTTRRPTPRTTGLIPPECDDFVILGPGSRGFKRRVQTNNPGRVFCVGIQPRTRCINPSLGVLVNQTDYNQAGESFTVTYNFQQIARCGSSSEGLCRWVDSNLISRCGSTSCRQAYSCPNRYIPPPNDWENTGTTLDGNVIILNNTINVNRFPGCTTSLDATIEVNTTCFSLGSPLPTPRPTFFFFNHNTSISNKKTNIPNSSTFIFNNISTISNDASKY